MEHRSALLRFVQGRPRLVIALLLGACGAGLLPGEHRIATRFLAGWNVAIWSYVVLVAWLMLRASAARVRSIAEREDPGAAFVLALMSFTAIASLGAIVFELAAVRDLALSERLGRYALTASTLFGSWLMVNTMFTFHYARMFYRAPSHCRPLRFPDDPGGSPDYWDFLYFSFTIAVAAQTSDVSVMTRPMRKLVLAQSVLSFLFNAAIIGMSINVAASLVGS